LIYFFYFSYYSVNYKDFLNNNNFNSNINNSYLNNQPIKLQEDLNYYKSEYEILKIQNNKLKEDNATLNNELLEAIKIISNDINKENNSNSDEINNLKNIIKNKDKEINDLKNMIINKDKEINNLKLQSQKNVSIKKSVNIDDIIVIQFVSLDQRMNCAIKCLKNDIFAEVEEKLYQKFEEYRETNNNFLAKGKLVLRFKKIAR